MVGVGLSGCGEDVDTAATGSNTLVVEVVDITDAQGSALRAELAKNVDPMSKPPMWNFLEADVTSSPFAYSETLGDLPEGEFSLAVIAEPPPGTAEGTAQKGIGCDMAFTLGKDDTLTVTIDGLNAFGDKGYGACTATMTR
jgi:hypothetical protein